MSAELYSFDTNILFYALDPDAGVKHSTASSLMASAEPGTMILSLQALSELCSSIRKKRRSLIPLADEFVLESVVLFNVVHALPSDLKDALAVHQQNKIPFWDAMLWATVRRAGCTLLLTEDFHDGQVLGGVTIRNPFVMSAAALKALLK